MSKGKKRSDGQVLLTGVLVSAGVYFVGVLIAALLLVKGRLLENTAFPVTAALCLLAALAGGFLTARRSSWGALPGALLNTAVFAGILIAVGLGFWQGITWSGRGGVVLLCALAGGVLAGLLGSRRGRRRKRK